MDFKKKIDFVQQRAGNYFHRKRIYLFMRKIFIRWPTLLSS